MKTAYFIYAIRRKPLQALAIFIVGAGLLITYAELVTLMAILRVAPNLSSVQRFFVASSIGIEIAAEILTPLAVYYILRLRFLISRILVAFFISSYYALELIVTLFYLTQHRQVDFFYFWLNRDVAYETLSNAFDYFPIILAGGVLSFLLFWWGLARIKRPMSLPNSKLFNRLKYPIIIVLIVNFFTVTTPFLTLLYDIRTTYHIIQLSPYDEVYKSSLTVTMPPMAQPSATNNSIVFLHLETVNSELVSPTTTPVLFDLAHKGVLFLKHHSGGIQTHRAEEVILCGALPSLFRSEDVSAYQNIVDYSQKEGIDLNCLPEVLKRAGYKTLFFKSHNLNFQRTGEFMPALGFDETHDQSDLMQPGDPLLPWGAREDVYYQRVVDYIADHYPQEKVFAYIAVSSTNHHSWERTAENTRPDVWQRMPFFSGSLGEKRRLESLYAQDAYVADFFNTYEKRFSFQNTDVFLYGDHPMPVYREKVENYIDKRSSHEENFLTVLGFIPAGNHAAQFMRDRIISEDEGTSHEDIAGTVLEMIGLQNIYPFSHSMYSILSGTMPEKSRCTFSVMPYFGAAVSLVQYPYKVVINLFLGRIEYSNLALAGERRSTLERDLKNADLYFNACRANRLSDIVGRS